jgi:hypothetical protein
VALTINTYTATYDRACRHQPRIRPGMVVRIAQEADARERDGFVRHLRSLGLDYVHEEWMPRLKADRCRIIKRDPADVSDD